MQFFAHLPDPVLERIRGHGELSEEDKRLVSIAADGAPTDVGALVHRLLDEWANLEVAERVCGLIAVAMALQPSSGRPVSSVSHRTRETSP